MFMAEPLPSLRTQLSGMLGQVDEQVKSLEAKKDYLKKQVKQDEENLNELVIQLYSRGSK